jgi:hypothetical protein
MEEYREGDVTTEEPISQEDYEKEVIKQAIEAWDSGTGNGDSGIQGLVPDMPKRLDTRYVPVLIGIIAMAAILIFLLTILLFGYWWQL